MSLKNPHDFFVEADVRSNWLVGADVIWADQDDHGRRKEQCHKRGNSWEALGSLMNALHS